MTGGADPVDGGRPNLLEQALAASLGRGADRLLSVYSFDGLEAQMTYAELERVTAQRAESLSRAGYGPGCPVALLGTTSLDLVCSVVAVWRAGAAPVVLSTPTRLQRLDLFLEETVAKLGRSQASLLLGDPDMVAPFGAMAGLPTASGADLEAGALEPLPEAKDRRGLPESCGLVQFSSGTTRDPQPILLSRRALLANSRAVLAQFPGAAENHSLVSWLPLYHDMGLIGCLLMPLLAPGSLTLIPPEVFAARPGLWLRAISEQRATTSSAPNFALGHTADRTPDSELAQLDLSCWRIAMVGAEPIRPATVRRFCERFAPYGFAPEAISPVYGLAEATLAVTFSPLGGGLRTRSYDSESLSADGRVLPGDQVSVSLGRPLPGVELSIRDSVGRELPQPHLGTVWVRGDSVMEGLLVDGELRSTLTDGWLETGDLGFLWAGELHLFGRRRDILLLDGRNHDPALLEAQYEAHPHLRRCCAFTEEGEERDRVVLLCEVGRDCPLAPVELHAELEARVPQPASLRPKGLVLVESGSLPVTSSGKLRRSEAAALYRQGALSRWAPTKAGRGAGL